MKHFSFSATTRLALSYLAILMVLSIGLSGLIYHTSARELARQLPPDSIFNGYTNTFQPNYDRFFANRINEGRGDLLGKLIILNLLVLIVGGAVSYYLARRTLEPIEAAAQAQSRFASDASHELRTPLAAVQAENEVALRNSNLPLKRAKELLQSNLEEVTRLKDLSENLLRLARDEPKDLPKVPVSLSDVATEAMNHVVKPAQAKDITVEDKIAKLTVLGDQQSLAQAAAVLLDNAIKYSPNGATVWLEASKHDKHAFLSVRDQGSGISPRDLPHVFDRFYRADSSRSSQNDGGYGLGLALAKKIVEQHGGEIIASSTLGKGSTFTIKLPLA